MPLFLLLLVVLIAGVIVGGAAAWLRQSRWRRRARRLAAELKAARAETETLRRRLEATPRARAREQSAIDRHRRLCVSAVLADPVSADMRHCMRVITADEIDRALDLSGAGRGAARRRSAPTSRCRCAITTRSRSRRQPRRCCC